LYNIHIHTQLFHFEVSDGAAKHAKSTSIRKKCQIVLYCQGEGESNLSCKFLFHFSLITFLLHLVTVTEI